MKHVFLLLCFCMSTFFSFAQSDNPQDSTRQISPWTKKASFGLNFSQVTLSNWAGGGQSSISITGLASFNANRETERSTWQNSLDLAYGQARQGGKERPFRKTDDQIILRSNYSRRLFDSKHWKFNANVDFRTQFDKGFKYEEDSLGNEREVFVSRFMAPAYLNTALGITYKVDGFSASLSPLSSKLTFVLDDTLSQQGAYGVEPGKKVRTQIAGISMQINVDYEVMENLQFKTSFLAFSEYKDKFQEIDIFWENQLIFKVNKLFNATVTTNLIYDEDVAVTRDDGTVGPATQFKSAINIGVLYTLP
ncbi:MAG: hypothetical protein KatS3mg033_1705 [Thermonema sp.]|uniref:DUF3078 domain-containing protein n=1 Tax=Thermonema sp. TaxID=2231181 RepID=UPI0021DCF58E|nr:DUF3078 domain-containing protein [Thermonema sp.]GIV39905.1 MAG: hypothetical protein KatS3mg033_1705 [Thermonema sp.]